MNKEMVQIPKKDLDSLTNSFVSLAESNAHARQDHKKMAQQNENIKNEMRNNNSVINDLKSKNNFLVSKLQERDEEINEMSIQVNTLETLNTIHSLFKDTIKTHHDFLQKVIDKLPLVKHYKEILKGYVSATLLDKDLIDSHDIAIHSLQHDHKSALEKYRIGSTVQEHEDLKIADKKIEQEITRPKSRGMSM